jgi:hypothetical protein
MRLLKYVGGDINTVKGFFMNKKSIFLVVLVGLLALVFISCGEPGDNSGPGSPKLVSASWSQYTSSYNGTTYNRLPEIHLTFDRNPTINGTSYHGLGTGTSVNHGFTISNASVSIPVKSVALADSTIYLTVDYHTYYLDPPYNLYAATYDRVPDDTKVVVTWDRASATDFSVDSGLDGLNVTVGKRQD